MILGDERPALIKLASGLEEFVGRAKQFEIANDADSLEATNMLVAAKTAWKQIEDDRERRKAPALNECRAIDNLYRPATDSFKQIEKIVKEKISTFLRRKQEEAARKLEAATLAREQAEQARRAALEAGNKKDVAKASMALIEADRAMPLENVVSGVRADLGTASVRFKKVAKLIDITQVPRDYLEQAVLADDSALLKLAIEAYKVNRAVPGVEVTEEQILAVRAGF